MQKHYIYRQTSLTKAPGSLLDKYMYVGKMLWNFVYEKSIAITSYMYMLTNIWW